MAKTLSTFLELGICIKMKLIKEILIILNYGAMVLLFTTHLQTLIQLIETT